MMRVFSGATVGEAMREFSFESLSVSIAGFRGDFTTEEAVGHDEVSKGEDEAEGPPYQSDVKRMWPGESRGDGDVAGGIAGGRQERGIESDGCAHQHENQVKAG